MLKTLLLSFAIESGLIPGHGISLYPVTDPTHQSAIDTRQTCYVDMSCKLHSQYFYLSGGMTAYEWSTRPAGEFYPCRMDYMLGAGATFHALTVGAEHGCFHPVAPNIFIYSYGKIDAANTRIFIRVEIEKKLFD